jgi:hypothetical protein
MILLIHANTANIQFPVYHRRISLPFFTQLKYRMRKGPRLVLELKIYYSFQNLQL